MKISELPQAERVTDADFLPVVQNGETKKANRNQILEGVPDGITQENGVLHLTANGEKVGEGVELPKMTVDSELSSESENPVQNKVVKAGLDGKLSNSAGAVKSENLADGQITEEKLSPDVVRKLNNTINSWKDVQNAVRLGLGASLFPVGYEFTTPDLTAGTDIIWVVRGHDHHRPANSRLTHSMTLETKYVYSGSSGAYLPLQFNAEEALYYAADGLAAGTYHFTWNYATGSMVNGTYQFTLTKAVPAGGQIVLGTNSNSTAITGCKIATYATVAATAAIESGIAVSTGSEGTSLGTVTTTSATSENLNCAQRIMWASNNYAQSAARQWLNSAAEAGSVWTPTNKFDRAPSWTAKYRGFMCHLPADFLTVVQPAIIPCCTNSVFEVNSLDGTEYTINKVYELQDEFFLLSRSEIYGTWDSSAYKDGELLEYYEGLTDSERKKYDASGAPRYSWIRSIGAWNACDGRIVETSGTLSSSSSSHTFGVAPACIIA